MTATALLIAGCGGSGDTAPQETKRASTQTSGQSKPKPAATKAPSDSEQLNRLLADRAAALRDGDSAGFLKTSTGSQAKKDERAIANAKALPISDVRLTAEGTEVDGNRGTLRVNMVYRFDEIDTFYVKTSRMTVKKTEGGWRVSRDRPSAGMLAPWEHTRYKARTSKHFLALAPASMKVGSLMTDLEKGRSRMKQGLKGVKVPGKVLVIVNRNSNDTRALTKDLKTLSALVAIAESQVFTEGSAKRVTDVAGQRVFVLWRSYGKDSRSGRRQTIAHELVHIALANRTGGRVPDWLVEGIAMYASGDKRAGDAGALLSGAQLKDSSKQAPAKAALSLSRLSKPDILHKMSSIPLTFAYSYSSAAAYTIADKYGGAKTLLKLYSAYNSEKIKGRPGKALTNKVFRKVLKRSIGQVEADIDAYARTQSPF
ncbi:gluzincin family metallopeptidase [Solirubrobacter deserti]|uniref:Peptidase MA-like domain-containing protein n=1 Tax=Solirubrobacter deserti TaxID=2282478 RepID=A0ABT4RPY0_9ACTN|nr:hypothetical protein [Solirubrobacter deserti]MDA0140540.1 hypothetical protein [Solirubrobacter deserti]